MNARVLHIDAGRELRGGQWQALFLLEKVGGILLTPGDSPLFRVAESRRIDVRALTLPRLYALSRQADLIHAHDARAHTLAVTVASRPVVVARRVAFPIRQGMLSRWKYRKAAHYIAVSDFVAATLRSAGISADRITTVHDGVPAPSWTSSLKPGWFIAPASNDPLKGSALARAAAREAGIDLHFSTNLTDDLRHAFALLYLTESEGLGSGALLALASGVPVIASRVGGLTEVVEHGVNGYTVANQTAAVVEAVRWLAADPELAAAMGSRGRERVLAEFSVDEMARKTVAVYERVLA